MTQNALRKLYYFPSFFLASLGPQHYLHNFVQNKLSNLTSSLPAKKCIPQKPLFPPFNNPGVIVTEQIKNQQRAKHFCVHYERILLKVSIYKSYI